MYQNIRPRNIPNIFEKRVFILLVSSFQITISYLSTQTLPQTMQGNPTLLVIGLMYAHNSTAGKFHVQETIYINPVHAENEFYFVQFDRYFIFIKCNGSVLK